MENSLSHEGAFNLITEEMKMNSQFFLSQVGGCKEQTQHNFEEKIKNKNKIKEKKNSFEILAIQDELIDRINWDKYPEVFNIYETIYDDFFGLKEKTYFNSKNDSDKIARQVKRQCAYYSKITELIKDDNYLISMAKNFKIIFKDKYKKKDVEEMFRLKDSCSIVINNKDKRNKSLSTEAENFFKLTHLKNKKSRESGEIFKTVPIPAFGCGEFPCFEFDRKTEAILKRTDFPDVGLIFGHGPNLKKSESSECLNEDYEYFKLEGSDLDFNKLRKYIEDISDTLFYAAIVMTERNNKTICYMRLPMIGLGVFCPKKHRKNVAEIYFQAYRKSLEEFSSQYQNMRLYVDFFDYGGDFEQIYKKVFVNESANKTEKKFVIQYYKEQSVFDLDVINPAIKQRTEEVFCTQCMASDARSFWNQNGIRDVSLERVMIGYDNDKMLIPGFLANCLGDLYFCNQPADSRIEHPLLDTESKEERERAEELEKKLLALPQRKAEKIYKAVWKTLSNDYSDNIFIDEDLGMATMCLTEDARRIFLTKSVAMFKQWSMVYILPGSLGEKKNLSLMNDTTLDNFISPQLGSQDPSLACKMLNKRVRAMYQSEDIFKDEVRQFFFCVPTSCNIDKIIQLLQLQHIGYMGNVTRKRDKTLHELMWGAGSYQQYGDIEIYTEKIPAFTIGAELKRCRIEGSTNYIDTKQTIGIVLTRGANFESFDTPDVKHFLNLTGNSEVGFEVVSCKGEELKKYLYDIFDSAFFTASKLGEKSGKKIWRLRIPNVGMGEYFRFIRHSNKEAVVREISGYYFAAYHQAYEKYSRLAESGGNTLEVYFYNFDDFQYVRQYFKEFFGKEKNCKIFAGGNMFEPTEDDEHIFHLLMMAGDPHAYPGNELFNDPSLEKRIMGCDPSNTEHLTVYAALALLPSFLFHEDMKRLEKITLRELPSIEKEIEKEETLEREREAKKAELDRQAAAKQSREEAAAREEEKNKEEEHRMMVKKLLFTGCGVLALIMFIYKEQCKKVCIDFKDYLFENFGFIQNKFSKIQ